MEEEIEYRKAFLQLTFLFNIKTKSFEVEVQRDTRIIANKYAKDIKKLTDNFKEGLCEIFGKMEDEQC